MARKLEPEEAVIFNDLSGETQAFEFDAERLLGNLFLRHNEMLDSWAEGGGAWFLGKLPESDS